MNRSSYFAVLSLITGLCFSVATAQKGDVDSFKSGGDKPGKVTIASGVAAVPMELVGRKPVVDVKINGKGPFRFFLDTGAGGTILDQKLADELKLPTDGQTKIGDPADPQGITANRNRIDTLEVGGAVFQDVIGVSWDRSAIYKDGSPRGVLGMPLFADLLLTVDYPKSRVIIGNGSLPEANGKDVIQYQYSEEHLFGIPLKVGEKNMVATLDTGSPGGLSFPSEYMEKLPLDGKPTEVGKARTVGGEAVIYGAKIKENVKLGNYVFESPNVTFFDRLVHLNIGYGLINQFALTVDQKNRRIRFAKATDGAGAVPAPADHADRSEYSGLYGIRRITVEQGSVFLQRLSGPQGEGPKLKLTPVSKDAFSIGESPDIRVKFERGTNSEITGIKVLTPTGEWESASKQRSN